MAYAQYELDPDYEHGIRNPGDQYRANQARSQQHMDKSSAQQEYENYIRSIGGTPNSDTAGDFENLWNQSAEAGLYSGPGYGKSWSENFSGFKPTLQARWQGPAGQHSSSQGGAVPPPAAPPSQPDYFAQFTKELLERQQREAAEQKARNDSLWRTYMDRAQQGLAIDRNNPVIRAQADAYSANEERSRRNYLADLAEESGPLANLQGEARLAAERVGQRTGAFEAELLSRELTARRDEVAQALAGLGSMLSADQTQALQRELGLLDNAIKQQQVGLSARGLDQEWQRALLQNDQFLRELGLNEWDRNNYWDALRRGLI
jgi:hypothetical protein